jgi:hypothetical protein
MKRVLNVVLALAALVISLTPAAFASEAELSDIQRPVDAVITQYPQYQESPSVGGLAGSAAVTEEQTIVEPLRFEGL